MQYNPPPILTQDLGYVLHVFFVGVLFLTSSQEGVFLRQNWIDKWTDVLKHSAATHFLPHYFPYTHKLQSSGPISHRKIEMWY